MKIKSFFLLTVLLLSTLACGLIGVPTNPPITDLPISATAPTVVIDSTSTPIPTFTPIATLTPAPPTESTGNAHVESTSSCNFDSL